MPIPTFIFDLSPIARDELNDRNVRNDVLSDSSTDCASPGYL